MLIITIIINILAVPMTTISICLWKLKIESNNTFISFTSDTLCNLLYSQNSLDFLYVNNATLQLEIFTFNLFAINYITLKHYKVFLFTDDRKTVAKIFLNNSWWASIALVILENIKKLKSTWIWIMYCS